MVNSTIQGSAADVMKDAMLRCRDELHRRQLPALLLAQARDRATALAMLLPYRATARTLLQPLPCHMVS